MSLRLVFGMLCAILGVGTAVWNTYSIEQDAALLVEKEGELEALREKHEMKRSSFRLAVQEYDFSRIHAALAKGLSRVSIDGDLLDDGGTKSGGGLERFVEIEPTAANLFGGLDDEFGGDGAGGDADDTGDDEEETVEEAIAATILRYGPALRSGAKNVDIALEATLRELAGAKKPHDEEFVDLIENLSELVASASGKAGECRKSIEVMLDGAKLGPRRLDPIETIRSYQVETLSRWRQYMQVAASDEPMKPEEIEAWEKTLTLALVDGSPKDLDAYLVLAKEIIARSDEAFARRRDDITRVAAEVAELNRTIERSRGIYSGIVTALLVLMMVKDISSDAKDRDGAKAIS